MTVDEILNAELTEEELDELVYTLTKRKDEIVKNKIKKAQINFEKAFTELMKIAPCESIDINIIDDEGIIHEVDILDVLDNYFYNGSSEYHVQY